MKHESNFDTVKIGDTMEEELKYEEQTIKQGKAEDILKDRGEVYGRYDVNLAARAEIMDTLNFLYKEKNKHDLYPIDGQALNDIVIKLVRLAASPEHLDSWLDIQGYAELNHKRLTDGSN